ncbi:unnamed protein product [Cylindrotheca closterium]|uniref:Calcineurin-like phosphoesterase domain-containing protein n=1 Tax=Cylindrotheca closterium TaxID=2856 RepID=A0AAD2FJG9_9STRA|nr:unnamed protein product [Cylindrotheca closterium]
MSSAQPTNNDNSNEGVVSKSATGSSQKETVRLVIISDTHGHHKKLTSILPKGDILIHLGDFCNKGSASDALEFANWITKMAAIPSNQKQISSQHALYEEIIVLEGNHDRTRKLSPAEIKAKPPIDLTKMFKRVNSDTDGKVQFLQDQMVQSKRFPLKFYGASWNSCAGDNFPTQFDFMGQEPPDVMLAHLNPYISSKITYPQLESLELVHAWRGAEGLSRTVLQNKIPLCMSGHLHWGRGVIHVPHNRNKQQQNNNGSSSVFINAASMKSHRDAGILYEPVVVDYDLEQRKPIRIDLSYTTVEN